MHTHMQVIFQLCSDALVQVQSRRVRFEQGYKLCQVTMIKQEGMGIEGISTGVCVTDYGI